MDGDWLHGRDSTVHHFRHRKKRHRSAFMTSKPYRPNVGIVLFNRNGDVLVGNRIQFPDVFQFPQGGIDEGEEPLQAALRELYEETSIQIQGPPAGQLDEWLYYEFPEQIPDRLKQYRGQKQKWFFFFWEGDLEQLQLDHYEQEFLSMEWRSMDQVVREIADFKKQAYREVAEKGGLIIREYLKARGHIF